MSLLESALKFLFSSGVDYIRERRNRERDDRLTVELNVLQDKCGLYTATNQELCTMCQKIANKEPFEKIKRLIKKDSTSTFACSRYKCVIEFCKFKTHNEACEDHTCEEKNCTDIATVSIKNEHIIPVLLDVKYNNKTETQLPLDLVILLISITGDWPGYCSKHVPSSV